MDRRRIVGTTAGALLGAVLLVAAYAKLLDPMAFAEQIELEGLAPAAAAYPLALGAIGLEVGLGLALVLGVRRLWILLPTAALVALFLFLTGRAYWFQLRGVPPPAASCGCFGNLLERSPAAAFWQDLALLVPLLGLAFLGRPTGRPRPAPLLATALTAVAAVAFARQAPGLPLDDLATRLRPGAEVEALCAGSGRERVCLGTLMPELGAGRHLIVLADLEDEAFGAQVAALNEYASRGEGPPLWVLTGSPPEAHRAFFWRFGPAFEVREAPPALLRSLYRRLPRSCLVAEGVVVETYPGLPPLARFGGDAAASSGT